MRKRFFAILALAAALCACSKEQMIESEITQPVEPGAPLVFTATMEDAPDSKATFDNTAKCASWEVGDQICINGFQYQANASGTNTTFSVDGNGMTREIRPVYVSSTNTQWYGNNPPSYLVDDAGTSTRWCASTEHRVDDVWNIVVSTGRPTQLKTILLWNAESGSGSYQNRIWKEIKVYGSYYSTNGWEEIKSFDDLNLQAGNFNLAGEVVIDASKDYTFYRIDVINNKGNDYMQMSDMKFVVSYDLRPAFENTTTPGHYGSLDASKLVDDSGPSLEWCTPTSAKVDGVWNIAVSTGSPTILKTIKLWNARNTVEHSGRTWKKVQLYGRLSSTDAWEFIKLYKESILR